MKYHIITFGCQMNKSDSERIAQMLEDIGYHATPSERNTDLILVNMCSVRQSAVDRVYGLLRKFEKLKAEKPKLKTILTGCVLKEDRKKFAKGFDLILTIKDLSKLPQKIPYQKARAYKEKTENNLKAQSKYELPHPKRDGVSPSGQVLSAAPPRRKQTYPLASVPISNGCNNFCSYCVVPFTRGSLICRNHRDVLREVKNLIKQAFKEIWLLGQNVNDYQSPADSSINFAKLLKMANDLPGDFSVRFASPNPKDFSDELIEVIAKSEKIARYLNLPVQSGDNGILKRMNRPYTVAQYKSLVRKIRKKIPDINLSTDVIVGFPGETKKQFENTIKLFKEIKFNIAYISRYSPRPGTVASRLKDNVSFKEKKRREKTLRNILN